MVPGGTEKNEEKFPPKKPYPTAFFNFFVISFLSQFWFWLSFKKKKKKNFWTFSDLQK